MLFNVQIKFSINGEQENVTFVCADMLKGGTRQMRYRLKKKYFDGVAANQVRTTSPCSSMNDAQWKKIGRRGQTQNTRYGLSQNESASWI